MLKIKIEVNDDELGFFEEYNSEDFENHAEFKEAHSALDAMGYSFWMAVKNKDDQISDALILAEKESQEGDMIDDKYANLNKNDDIFVQNNGEQD